MNQLKTDIARFNPGLFWDVHINSINPRDHAHYIIERVVTRGNLSDWQRLKALYGLEKIKEISLQIRSLDKKTLSFLSTYFGLKKEEFRCYK